MSIVLKRVPVFNKVAINGISNSTIVPGKILVTLNSVGLELYNGCKIQIVHPVYYGLATVLSYSESVSSVTLITLDIDFVSVSFVDGFILSDYRIPNSTHFDSILNSQHKIIAQRRDITALTALNIGGKLTLNIIGTSALSSLFTSGDYVYIRAYDSSYNLVYDIATPIINVVAVDITQFRITTNLVFRPNITQIYLNSNAAFINHQLTLTISDRDGYEKSIISKGSLAGEIEFDIHTILEALLIRENEYNYTDPIFQEEKIQNYYTFTLTEKYNNVSQTPYIFEVPVFFNLGYKERNEINNLYDRIVRGVGETPLAKFANYPKSDIYVNSSLRTLFPIDLSIFGSSSGVVNRILQQRTQEGVQVGTNFTTTLTSSQNAQNRIFIKNSFAATTSYLDVYLSQSELNIKHFWESQLSDFGGQITDLFLAQNAGLTGAKKLAVSGSTVITPLTRSFSPETGTLTELQFDGDGGLTITGNEITGIGLTDGSIVNLRFQVDGEQRQYYLFEGQGNLVHCSLTGKCAIVDGISWIDDDTYFYEFLIPHQIIYDKFDKDSYIKIPAKYVDVNIWESNYKGAQTTVTRTLNII